MDRYAWTNKHTHAQRHKKMARAMYNNNQIDEMRRRMLILSPTDVMTHRKANRSAATIQEPAVPADDGDIR